MSTSRPTVKSWHRRQFLRNFGLAVGLGWTGPSLTGCGEATSPVPTSATASPPPASTPPPTTTTISPFPSTPPTTTSPSPSSPPPTAMPPVTLHPASPTPDSFVRIGNLPSYKSSPVSFSSGDEKGFIYAENASEIYVYSNRCTHQSCQVNLISAFNFQCPCHASEFDAKGEVTNGPARLRLYRYESKVVDGIVYARLS